MESVALQDNHIDQQTQPPDTGPMMFLSLFLLLLAFFILLTAISTFEETKSREVLSSVASTFKADETRESTAQIVISTIGAVPEPEEVVDDVERLWITAIPIAKVEALKSGRTLQLTVPATEVFLGGEGTIRSDRNDLLRATAYALAARLEGFTAQLRFTVPTDELEEVDTTPFVADDALEDEFAGAVILNPDDTSEQTADPVQRELPERNQLPFLRAAAFAQALIDAGAPPDGISAGIGERQGRRIRLRFDIVERGKAHVTFAADQVDNGERSRLTGSAEFDLDAGVDNALPSDPQNTDGDTDADADADATVVAPLVTPPVTPLVVPPSGGAE